MKPHIRERKSAPRLEALEGRALLSTFLDLDTGHPVESTSLNFAAVSTVGVGAAPVQRATTGTAFKDQIEVLSFSWG